MGKYAQNKKLSLAKIGDGWQDAYIELSKIGVMELGVLAPYIEDATNEDDKKAQVTAALAIYEDCRELVKKHFLNGKGFVEQKDIEGKPVLEEITVEDATTDLYDDIFPIFMEFIATYGADRNLSTASVQP